jgi:hypothetical protein
MGRQLRANSGTAAPDDSGDPLASLRPFTYLAVLGYVVSGRACSTRAPEVGYVPSDIIGPTDPPRYITPIRRGRR